MRDRTNARNYSPEREQFRREHARRREVGLARRHALKLHHQWHRSVSDEPPAIGRSGEGAAWRRCEPQGAPVAAGASGRGDSADQPARPAGQQQTAGRAAEARTGQPSGEHQAARSSGGFQATRAAAPHHRTPPASAHQAPQAAAQHQRMQPTSRQPTQHRATPSTTPADRPMPTDTVSRGASRRLTGSARHRLRVAGEQRSHPSAGQPHRQKANRKRNRTGRAGAEISVRTSNLRRRVAIAHDRREFSNENFRRGKSGARRRCRKGEFPTPVPAR